VASYSDEPGRPDVWVFDRTSDAFRSLKDLGPVSDDERARADRLQDPNAGADLLARRAALRRVLALYLDRSPEDVRLVTLPGGKPTFLPHADDARRLAFSAGGTGGLFCMAVGAVRSLGVVRLIVAAIKHQYVAARV
jgi:phosphopantetheinyl transferase